VINTAIVLFVELEFVKQMVNAVLFVDQLTIAMDLSVKIVLMEFVHHYVVELVAKIQIALMATLLVYFAKKEFVKKVDVVVTVPPIQIVLNKETVLHAPIINVIQHAICHVQLMENVMMHTLDVVSVLVESVNPEMFVVIIVQIIMIALDLALNAPKTSVTMVLHAEVAVASILTANKNLLHAVFAKEEFVRLLSHF